MTDGPLRIALVSRQYPPDWFGGIGVYNQTLAALLAGAGHDVTVIAQPADGRARSYREGAVSVVRVPSVGPRRVWRAIERFQPTRITMANLHAGVNRARSVRQVERASGIGPFDVVEVPEWRGQALFLPFVTNAPVVNHLHLPLAARDAWNDFDHGDTADRRFAARLERLGAGRASAVTACSHTTVALPGGQPWLAPESVTLVAPPMADWWLTQPTVESGSEAVAAIGTGRVAGPTVLVAGHLEHRKGPDIAVDVVAALASEVPGLKLRFVGKSFPWAGIQGRDHVRRRADAAGMEVDVVDPVVGREAMRDEYLAADVVLAPSRFEPLHLVALEAMACGRPVVVSDRTGVAELLGPEVSGLVAPVDDIDAWVALLRPLVTDQVAAAMHGAAGQQAVRALCDPVRVVGDRERVYRAAITAARR